MPITNRLTLDTSNETVLEKITSVKRFLKPLQMNHIIENMDEWRLILEATARSLLVYLAILILAIDEKGRN